MMGGLLKLSALLLVLALLLVSGVNIWLREKSYVFSAEEVAAITNRALEETKGEGHNATFSLVESLLCSEYPGHILPAGDLEWLFVNAGGWMGAMYVLHASTTEYLLFFGTAIDTSGHSGRYWANISDTVIEGTYVQWPEGSTTTHTYAPGDTVIHLVGEAAAVQWSANFWAVEYGRGFVPSTLGFALADTVFSTQDFYLLFKIVKLYVKAIFQELMLGNL